MNPVPRTSIMQRLAPPSFYHVTGSRQGLRRKLQHRRPGTPRWPWACLPLHCQGHSTPFGEAVKSRTQRAQMHLIHSLAKQASHCKGKRPGVCLRTLRERRPEDHVRLLGARGYASTTHACACAKIHRTGTCPLCTQTMQAGRPGARAGKRETAETQQDSRGCMADPPESGGAKERLSDAW